MRVLQVLPSIASESGGPVRSTLANCRAVQEVDPDVRYTLAGTERALDLEWRRKFERRMPEGMELRLFRATGRHAFTYSLSLMAWLWRHVRDYDLAVVHVLLHPISSSAARIARHHGVPYLLVPHGTLSDYTFEHRRTWLKRAYFQIVERGTLRGAAAVRFTADTEVDEAPSWGRNTSVRVIAHPFESRVRGFEPLDPDSHRVLFLSRFHPVKGLDVLLPAFRHLRERIPDAELVLAGAGTEAYEARIRDEIHSLGLAEAVRLPGFVEGEEKARLLAESSVFVLPSHQENFGVAIVEAMDAGLPVVISCGVGIWRQVEGAGAGLVVHRGPKAVADALAALLSDPERRRRMGASGRELVKTRFAPERIGRELRILYRDAAATGDRPAGRKV